MVDGSEGDPRARPAQPLDPGEDGHRQEHHRRAMERQRQCQEDAEETETAPASQHTQPRHGGRAGEHAELDHGLPP